ncbi:MAG: ASKHA domain-containing protein [Dehalococcoidales bacterium]|nr:ASKHA domain-containing protein [Dehalococcoidales bacterium]
MTEENTEIKYTVHFEPDNIDIVVSAEANLMEAAVAAGVHINASCGGAGVCGTCNVIIKRGQVESTRTDKISEHDYKKGFRQACKSRIMSNLIVEIPATSKLEKAVLSREELLSSCALASGWKFDPPVKKAYLELTPPAMEDNTSDLSRLLKGLKQQSGYDKVSVDSDILYELADILRKDDWSVTVTLLEDSNNSFKLINIEPGDTRAKNYTLVFDIGTTAVRGQLLDLNRGRMLAQGIDYNRQISYGEDVISRIAWAQKQDGMEKLQKAVVATINDMIKNLAKRANIDISDIAHIVFAANTVMTHLLLGLNPKYLRLSPYVPTANYLPLIKAHKTGIEVADSVYLYSLPCVASYVGGDIVSGILGTGIYQKDKLTLYIDIGTNGEIVIGNRDWMVTAACSAGPTFEGGGIKHGMIATSGAIEGFDVDARTYEPLITTIDNAKPKGICGSGLINIGAKLLDKGVIDQNGKFNTGLLNRRIREGAHGFEYVLAYGAETQTYKDIVLTETDIANLIRSKAAMYAGYQTLLQSVDKKFINLEQVIIAGTFGNNINIENAITIGLLPDIPRNRFLFVGNGSLLGARLSAFSRDLLNEGRKISSMMTNLELSENSLFMDNYIAALFLPHTDGGEFPSVRLGGK